MPNAAFHDIYCKSDRGLHVQGGLASAITALFPSQTPNPNLPNPTNNPALGESDDPLCFTLQKTPFVRKVKPVSGSSARRIKKTDCMKCCPCSRIQCAYGGGSL